MHCIIQDPNSPHENVPKLTSAELESLPMVRLPREIRFCIIGGIPLTPRTPPIHKIREFAAIFAIG